MTAGAAIAVSDLKFGYGQGRSAHVLDIHELTIARGERVFLYGPSGSGKTTLLGLLSGILDAREGSVNVLGRDFSTLRGRERDKVRGAHIGYIFQMFNLIPYLDVQENILLPCRISAARRARVRGSLEAGAKTLASHLGIEHLLRSPVTELSVGQQQRVAAARALIGAPELVIADEPTSALDTDHREAFLRVLFQEAASAGAAVLFVSHDHGLRSLFERTVSLKEINRCSR